MLPPAGRPSYSPEFFAPLGAVEDRHFWFRARTAILGALFAQLVAPLAPGYRVLEVGCGNGNVLGTLLRTCVGGKVVGLDLHREGLDAARRTGALLVQGTIAALPFQETFDLIGTFDVIEHLSDDRGALAEIVRLLRPGGRLVVTVPAYRSLWSHVDTAACHRRRYAPRDLRRLLQDSGLEIEYLTPYMMPLYPIIWAGRRLTAVVRGKGPATSTELAVVPGLNSVLLRLLLRERHLVTRRRVLPFGSSLLAVATRP